MNDTNERFSRMEDKIDKVIEKISSIDKTLVKQSVILDEHVKRSTQLENRMDPVETHVKMINGVIKFILLVSAIAGIVAVFK